MGELWTAVEQTPPTRDFEWSDPTGCGLEPGARSPPKAQTVPLAAAAKDPEMDARAGAEVTMRCGILARLATPTESPMSEVEGLEWAELSASVRRKRRARTFTLKSPARGGPVGGGGGTLSAPPAMSHLNTAPPRTPESSMARLRGRDH